jgi:transposase
MFQYRQALVRLRQGDSERDLARARLMGRRKLAAFRALATAQGWLDSQTPLPEDEAIAVAVGQARRAPSSVSSVEPYRELVTGWTEQGISSVVIHGVLCRNHGYTGSYSSVYRMVAAIGRSRPEATVRLTFAPGEAAQVDFGAGPVLIDPARDGPRRTWAFVMTLCFSRHQYVEFVWDQTVATWLGCHRRAFEWFGAVPERLIIDNPKCAITKACTHEPTVQRSYAECAEGYGFKIEPCPPADPQKKGIVEAGVKYVKGNFLPTRSFRDLADLNTQARQWVMEHAGRRRHGTTAQAPLDRFEIEQALMRALPAIAPDLGVWTRLLVHRDCHVQFDYSLYSAPFALVGKSLWVRTTDTTVSIYEEGRLAATHPRSRKRGARSSVQDHLPPEAQAFFAHDRAWCLTQARRIGPACTEVVERLLSDRILERLRSVQALLRLAQRHTPVRLEAACVRALFHASPFYRTVKTILAGNFDQLPLPHIDSDTAYGAQARFAREATDLFNPEQSPSHRKESA